MLLAYFLCLLTSLLVPLPIASARFPQAEDTNHQTNGFIVEFSDEVVSLARHIHLVETEENTERRVLADTPAQQSTASDIADRVFYATVSSTVLRFVSLGPVQV